MRDCERCKGMVVLSSFSYSKCENCGCDVVTSHMPSYRYCKECADILNVCQQCGTDRREKHEIN